VVFAICQVWVKTYPAQNIVDKLEVAVLQREKVVSVEGAVLEILRKGRLQRQLKEDVQVTDHFHHVVRNRVGLIHEQQAEMKEKRRIPALQRLQQATLESVELFPCLLVAGPYENIYVSRPECH
jgi:hypothetical protein